MEAEPISNPRLKNQILPPPASLKLGVNQERVVGVRLQGSGDAAALRPAQGPAAGQLSGQPGVCTPWLELLIYSYPTSTSHSCFLMLHLWCVSFHTTSAEDLIYLTQGFSQPFLPRQAVASRAIPGCSRAQAHHTAHCLLVTHVLP